MAQNAEADRLTGIWEPSNGRARAKIDRIGSKYYGRIVWLKEANDPETGEPKVDKNNPDESMPILLYVGTVCSRILCTKVMTSGVKDHLRPS